MKLLSRIVESFFFRTDRLPYWHASHFNLNSESFQLVDSKGDLIAGQLLFSQKNHSNVVLHCHAGTANMHWHLPQVAFLAQAGYPVALFDYAGCGVSDGTLGLEQMGATAQSVARWITSQPDFDNARFIVFGQGLGADAALQFYEHNKDITSALILESLYPDRKSWIKHRFGPILGDLMAMVLDVNSTEPAEILPKIQVPTLMAYPEHDAWLIPRDKASVLSLLPPSAQRLESMKTQFLTIFTDPSGQNARQLLRWLKEHGL